MYKLFTNNINYIISNKNYLKNFHFILYIYIYYRWLKEFVVSIKKNKKYTQII